MPKRSVADIRDFWPPARVLEIARAAYSEEFISDDVRLEHSALVPAHYLPGFRIGEALSLTKSQFRWQTSLEGELFLVIEQVKVEKSGGKFRSYPILPGDPLARPLLSHLAQVEDDLDFVFTVSQKTVRNILDRVTKGEVWPHWFREQRNTFLATAFTRDERNRIFAWSGNVDFNKAHPKRRRRSMADHYDSMNWMSFADRLSKLTRSYWLHASVPHETQSWLDSLPPSLKAPDVPSAAP